MTESSCIQLGHLFSITLAFCLGMIQVRRCARSQGCVLLFQQRRRATVCMSRKKTIRVLLRFPMVLLLPKHRRPQRTRLQDLHLDIVSHPVLAPFTPEIGEMEQQPLDTKHALLDGGKYWQSTQQIQKHIPNITHLFGTCSMVLPGDGSTLWSPQ